MEKSSAIVDGNSMQLDNQIPVELRAHYRELVIGSRSASIDCMDAFRFRHQDRLHLTLSSLH